MIKLAVAGIVAIILLIAFLLIVRNKPDLWFWIFLNLYFDPGGYVGEYLDGKLIGPLNLSDVLIVGIVICLLTAKINWEVIFQDKLLKQFLLFLSVYSLYYFIVFGGIVPYFNNDFDYANFLLKTRTYEYGIIILIAVYVFSLRSLRYLYITTLFIGIICLSLYLITLLTGLNLIPVITLLREGTEMTRITLSSYGLFYMIFPWALIIYLLSRKINMTLEYKFWLFSGGIIMALTLLITLTRRTQIDIISLIIIIVIIISYLFRTGKLTQLYKIVLPVILVILALYLTFPKYLNFITVTAQDTFFLLTTGSDTRDTEDYRTAGSGDLEITKEYIRNNLLFGTGYSYLYWGPGYAYSERGIEYSRAMDAAGEVPIYYILFGYGISGAILMLPLYFVMLVLYFRFIRLLRMSLMNYLQEPITLMLSIYVLFILAQKFTVKIAGLGYDFSSHGLDDTGILLGVGFALHRKIFSDIIT